MLESVLPDYYYILGLHYGADLGDIKQAYRRLALEHHPDCNHDDTDAEARFKALNEAYTVLSDHTKRLRYDEYWQTHYNINSSNASNTENTKSSYSNSMPGVKTSETTDEKNWTESNVEEFTENISGSRFLGDRARRIQIFVVTGLIVGIAYLLNVISTMQLKSLQLMAEIESLKLEKSQAYMHKSQEDLDFATKIEELQEQVQLRDAYIEELKAESSRSLTSRVAQVGNEYHWTIPNDCEYVSEYNIDGEIKFFLVRSCDRRGGISKSRLDCQCQENIGRCNIYWRLQEYPCSLCMQDWQ